MHESAMRLKMHGGATTQDRPSCSMHVHHEDSLSDSEELTAALAMACALPPPLEPACASALATALLLVFRQFSMAWLLAAA